MRVNIVIATLVAACCGGATSGVPQAQAAPGSAPAGTAPLLSSTSPPSNGVVAGTGAQPSTAKSLRETYATTAQHVVQLACIGGVAGSGFVHKGGLVVTAAHDVMGCKAADLRMLVNGWSVTTKTPASKIIGVTEVVAVDEVIDVALLRPSEKLAPGLSIVDTTADVQIGDTVEFIGYPGGYEGVVPMLGVGYLAGLGPYPTVKPGTSAMRGFVNGAFNHGNSGGPVIDLTTGEVIGVVHAKLAPLPAPVDAALTALKNQTSGFGYDGNVNGKPVHMTEAQVVESVLEHFASQVQLVVGVMVLPTDVRTFLTANKVTP